MTNVGYCCGKGVSGRILSHGEAVYNCLICVVKNAVFCLEEFVTVCNLDFGKRGNRIVVSATEDVPGVTCGVLRVEHFGAEALTKCYCGKIRASLEQYAAYCLDVIGEGEGNKACAVLEEVSAKSFKLGCVREVYRSKA